MMIRKVFVRAMGSNSTILNRTISSLPPSLIQSHSFSTGAPTDDKDAVDATLYKLLKHEIKSLKFTLSNDIPKVNRLPESFPYKIVVENEYSINNGDNFDDEYYRFLILQRLMFVDETEMITVKIDTRDVDAKHMELSYETSSDDDKEKDIKEVAIPMIVSVEKELRYETSSVDTYYDVLNIRITLSTQDINIQSFYFDSTQGNSKDIADVRHLGVEGPKFKELDNELQQCLYKYLEIRGIKSSIASTLLEYIAVKNKRHYLAALKDLVEIIDD